MRGDTLKNPYNNKIINTNDWSSLNLEGLAASSIYYMPIPGMDATMSINPNDDKKMLERLKNLIPYRIIQMPGQTPASTAPAK